MSTAGKDYWLRRALEDERIAHEMAGKTSQEIQKIYKRQYKKVVAQMERLYGTVQWGEEHRLTRTQLWQYSRWREFEAALRQYATETPKVEIEKITSCMNGVFQRVIGADVERFSGSGSAAFRVSTNPMAIIDTAWSGASYSERVWKNTSALAARIRGDMEDMMVQGRGLSDIRKRLMQDFSVGFNSASTLVDTEAAYVMNRAAVERYKSAGLAKVRWSIGQEDGKECEICKERQNKVYFIDRAPVIPAHPRCRCVYAGVVELPGEEVPAESKIDKKLLNECVKNGIIKPEEELPELRSLSNIEARIWYIDHNNRIPEIIDRTQSIEAQARQAFELRNTMRTMARDFMQDQEIRMELDRNSPNKTFESLVKDKMDRKGKTREEAIQDILQTATKTNRDVNISLGLERK